MQLHYWALAAPVGVVAAAASCVAVAVAVAVAPCVAAGMPFGFASSVVDPVVKIGSVHQKVVVGQTFAAHPGETSVAASFVGSVASFVAGSVAASFVAGSGVASFVAGSGFASFGADSAAASFDADSAAASFVLAD